MGKIQKEVEAAAANFAAEWREEIEEAASEITPNVKKQKEVYKSLVEATMEELLTEKEEKEEGEDEENEDEANEDDE